MSTEIRIIAKSVPAIAIVLGFLFLMTGMSSGNEEMVSSGWIFVLFGFVLQVMWLLTKRRW